MAKRTFYIVSGNINGSEVKPRLCATREDADHALADSFLSSMRELDYIKSDGGFKDSVMVHIDLRGDSGCVGLGPWQETQVYEHLERLGKENPENEHFDGVRLRHRHSRQSFAEWQVTEVTL